ncbi:rhomboid family intramembrane serine protease [Legionella sp. W05-934-2]|jgi:membrane associated rhomboid family serine protease|uniref:rhomboid family intramembrane serine protease n=1 Tax=Legionella sp. W05-934-2 TaxID=1198649 RepID=UPI0034620852
MLNQFQDSLAQIAIQTQSHLSQLVFVTSILWISFLLNQVLGNWLFRFGIFPRHIRGLPGVFFAPFIHADFNHLFFNTIPFIVLANFIMIQGVSLFYNISIFIIIVSGLITWVIGKRGIHIGASGLITGYWAYLLADGFQNPSLTTVIVALIVVYYFAGIFFGLFPSKKGVSWEGHLSGAIAGVLVVVLQNITL